MVSLEMKCAATQMGILKREGWSESLLTAAIMANLGSKSVQQLLWIVNKTVCRKNLCTRFADLYEARIGTSRSRHFKTFNINIWNDHKQKLLIQLHLRGLL